MTFSLALQISNGLQYLSIHPPQVTMYN